MAALPVLAARYEVKDTGLPGFSVRVTPGGVKSLSLLYRPKGSRVKRRLTLGAFPAVTPEKARRRAMEAKGAAAGGADPAGPTRAARKAARHATADEAVTVAALGTRYLAKSEGRLRPSTAVLYRRLLRLHLEPALGTHLVGSVTTADLSALHARLKDRRTVADAIMRLASTLFRFAEREGLRPRGTNPATDVPRYQTPEDARRERYLEPAEVAALLDALDRAETVGVPSAPAYRRKRSPDAVQKRRPRRDTGAPVVASPFTVAALRFALLTGLRKREALGLRWAEVDRGRGLLLLDATKTGRSTRPLSAAAAAILDGLPRVVGSPWVFPSTRDLKAPIVNIDRVWAAVKHAAGLDGVRIHDLRHTAASMMLQAGATLAEVGRALGHTSSRATERYAHVSDAGAQRAAELLGAAVAAQRGAAAPIPAVVRPIAVARREGTERNRA